MSKKTAVEWFYDKIKSHFEHDGDLLESLIFTMAIAKKKEREQHSKTWDEAIMVNGKLDFKLNIMETNIEQLKCGQCDQEKHRIYQRQNKEIILECIQCESQSEIVLTNPEIKIRNNSGLGTICKF